MFSLPTGTKMFHFPALPPTPLYIQGRATGHYSGHSRFPHSDTPGSQLAHQLPRAYRRSQRPSSALGAKASTDRTTQLCTTPRRTNTYNNKDTRIHYTVLNHHTNTTRTPHHAHTHATQHRTGHHTCDTPQPNSMPSTPPITGRTPTFHSQKLLRKEVIQPHLPVRLPCYDLVLITSPTFDGSPTTVRPPASGVTNFHDLTGGVYKPRERIHRSVADLRLLATPTS